MAVYSINHLSQLPGEYDYSNIYKSPQGVSIYQNWYEECLADFQAPYERLVVETRFGYTHLLATGPRGASPLILIHGRGDNSISVWEAQLNYFARAGTHRVYSLDIPGISPASAPTLLSPSSQDYGIWLLEVMSELGLRKADFVALASGCGVVFKFASYAPGRINSAVLINPPGVGKPKSSLSGLAGSILINFFPSKRNVSRLVKNGFVSGARISETTLQKAIEHNLIIFKHTKLQAMVESVSDEDLQKLTFPCLLILGRYNRVISNQDTIARFQRFVPRLSVLVAPDSGFQIDVERPKYLTSTITGYLQYVAAFYGPPAVPA